MDSSKAINRYRNLVVVCILLIGALGLALYESKVEQYQQQQDRANTPAEPISSPSEALFRIGKTVYSFEMLPQDLQSPLYQIRKMALEQQLLVLEQALVETHIATQIAASGNEDQVLAELFPNISVTDEEVADYYQQNQNAKTPPLETLKPQLTDYLLALKREAAKKTLLGQLLVSGEAQFLMEPPTPPTSTQ